MAQAAMPTLQLQSRLRGKRALLHYWLSSSLQKTHSQINNAAFMSSCHNFISVSSFFWFEVQRFACKSNVCRAPSWLAGFHSTQSYLCSSRSTVSEWMSAKK